MDLTDEQIDAAIAAVNAEAPPLTPHQQEICTLLASVGQATVDGLVARVTMTVLLDCGCQKVVVAGDMAERLRRCTPVVGGPQ